MHIGYLISYKLTRYTFNSQDLISYSPHCLPSVLIGIRSTYNPLIDIFLHFCHLSDWYCADNVRRNYVLITHGVKGLYVVLSVSTNLLFVSILRSVTALLSFLCVSSWSVRPFVCFSFVPVCSFECFCCLPVCFPLNYLSVCLVFVCLLQLSVFLSVVFLL